jgi:hypothetical protein
MKTRRRLAPKPPRVRAILPFLLIAACFASRAVHAAHADEWLPIAQEELKMTSDPKAPGASAIMLYRQVDRDDFASREYVYVRIKILTQEGLKLANVEIPFQKEYEGVVDIAARTIHPDGSIVTFDGKVYDQPVLASRGTNTWMKTFTMPAAEVGSIIEYRYQHRLRFGWVYDSHWILSSDLFTRDAKFSLEPNRRFSLRWSAPLRLPEGAPLPKEEHGSIRLEVHDVPAFVTEPNMPPQNQLRLRVDFVYLNNPYPEKDPADFWKNYAKRVDAATDQFLGWHRSMAKAVAQIVQPGDSPELKLRKIYARTQQIENLSYERPKTEQEVDRENPKDIHDAEDVWSRGYANRAQITWLFLALTRAAGIETYQVLVSARDRYFFDQRLMNPGEITANLVLAKLDGKDIYFAPGVPFAPFGMLPWEETAVSGLLLGKDGARWISTPLPTPSLSTVQRKATLHLDESGTLAGKVVVTYTGIEALWRRLRERNEDGPARTQFLEQDLERAVPVGIDVTLTNEPEWRSSDPQLVAEYDVRVPGWATSAGRYHLLTMGLFGAEDKHAFEPADRVQPIYFDFPYEHRDDVSVELPSGWRVSSTPQPQKSDRGALIYTDAAQSAGGELQLQRDLTVNLLLVGADHYDVIRDFFQTVRTGDEEQIVLSPQTAVAH